METFSSPTHAANAAEIYTRRVYHTIASSVVSGHESTRNLIRDAIRGCSEMLSIPVYTSHLLFTNCRPPDVASGESLASCRQRSVAS